MKNNSLQSVANKHQLNIAHKTMFLSCVGAVILGMSHKEAKAVIERLSKSKVNLDPDCECE